MSSLGCADTSVPFTRHGRTTIFVRDMSLLFGVYSHDTHVSTLCGCDTSVPSQRCQNNPNQKPPMLTQMYQPAPVLTHPCQNIVVFALG